jgi:ABC-type branched-subunit amino acid transport system ATPase component
MSVLKNLTLGAYVHRATRPATRSSLQEVFELFPILAERSEGQRPARCPAASSRWWPSAAR